MNLLSLTSCCVDYYPQLNRYFLGGNSLNVASMWKTLAPGENVSVIARLGNDANALLITDFLKKKNINISGVRQIEGITANNSLRVDTDGERYGIEGAWNGGVYETFLLSEKDWQQVAKQNIIAIPGNNPNFKEMTKRKLPGQFLSVDYLDVENKVPLSETIDYTDIAFMAATPELLHEYKDIAFTKRKMIVVTLGKHGSYTFHLDEEYFQPALKVDKIMDTTGCGDAYQAAFALTYYKTKDIQKSMSDGANAASKVLQAWGGAII
jgi:sugar/nucleoside kinase (ribokinase family)